MKFKKVTALVLSYVIAGTLLAGCSNGEAASSGSQVQKTDPPAEENDAAGTTTAETGDGETVDLEIWTGSVGFQEVKKDGPLYNLYQDMIGVGITQPYVEWNGGTTYQEQLNLRISAGEMPDMFVPVNGMETDLVKNGALLNLTDLLPEKAPNLWNIIPEEVWDVIRSYDPSGEGRIYMIPSVVNYPINGGMIRQDWLDKLQLSMPTTQDEFVEVLRAFKTQDPNGNGETDEIPTGGRAEARWMDHLFAMYGIAMWEGFPQFDVYDGELTYSAVTENMRDCLEWLSELYAEGLMDPETLLNDKAGWEGKVNSDKVGVFYHQCRYSYQYAETMKAATGVEPEWKVLPAISAPGYEGFYTEKQITDIWWVVKNTDDQGKIDAVMKVLDACGNEELWDDFDYGAEGMHHDVVNGEKVMRVDDMATQENKILVPSQHIATVESWTKLLEGMATEERAWAVNDSIENLQENAKYGKTIASDGMPSSVYDGYPDIQNRTLYAEYASKIITGDYPIEKFDEFVEKWYASGGEEVTKAAREWYAKTQY